MSAKFPHTMTWYAKTDVANVFVRTVVAEVMWQAQKVNNMAKSGLIDSDKATVYVPYVTDDGVNRKDLLTFKSGDYLVFGIATEEMVDSTYTPTKLLAQYADAVQIRSVDQKRYGVIGLQHVQIGGK